MLENIDDVGARGQHKNQGLRGGPMKFDWQAYHELRLWYQEGREGAHESYMGHLECQHKRRQLDLVCRGADDLDRYQFAGEACPR